MTLSISLVIRRVVAITRALRQRRKKLRLRALKRTFFFETLAQNGDF